MNRLKSLLYNEKYAALLLAAPGVIWLLFYTIGPFASAIVFSLTNRTLVPNPKLGTSFVGLKNYLELFQDEEFFVALLNTAKFSVMAVTIQCSLAILLAVLLNNKLKGIGFFRMMYFMPLVLPMLVVSVTWSLLFAPDKNGFINSLLHALSFGQIDPLKWLYSPVTAMMSIVILSVWAGVSFQTVIILAGLQSVDVTLYEAAEIDGANTLQKFRYITLSEIRNTIIFVFLSSTILSFKLFTQILVMTQGGPRNSTLSLVYLIYSKGYIDQRIGYASALSVVFFLIVLFISLVQQRFIKMASK